MVEKRVLMTPTLVYVKYRRQLYILNVQNIRKTVLMLSCTPFCPKSSLNLSGHWLYKMSKAFHRDAVPCWLDVLWVVDHSWYTQETVEHEKPSSVAVLDTLKPVRLAPTTIPCSKALKYLVLPIQPLNGTHMQSSSSVTGRGAMQSLLSHFIRCAEG